MANCWSVIYNRDPSGPINFKLVSGIRTTLYIFDINHLLICCFSYFSCPLLPGRIKSMADERECLAKALQANIVPLVDCLQFNYSELPEMMISGGHITEDECRMIRDDLSRKDQVRYLISRTKGRSLGDMQAFLAIISKDAPDVVQKIKDKFEENKRNNVKCTTCALCQCYNTIDIKDIVDNLWSEQAIPDGFYNEVVACSKPRGSQTNLWIRLIDFLNSKQNSERMILFENLFNSILLKGNFGFLVKPMRQLVNVRNVLECNCFLMRKMSLDRRLSCWSSNRPDSSSTCSPRSSYSDRPSSSLSRELLSDVDAYERINIDRDSFKMCDMKQTACIGIDTIDDTGTRRRVGVFPLWKLILFLHFLVVFTPCNSTVRAIRGSLLTSRKI